MGPSTATVLQVLNAGGSLGAALAACCVIGALAGGASAAPEATSSATGSHLVPHEVLAGPQNRRLRFFAQVSDGCPRRVSRTALVQRRDEVVVGFVQEREPQTDSRAYVCTQAVRTVCLEILLERPLGDRRVVTLDGRRRVAVRRRAPDGRRTCARVPAAPDSLTL